MQTSSDSAVLIEPGSLKGRLDKYSRDPNSAIYRALNDVAWRAGESNAYGYDHGLHLDVAEQLIEIFLDRQFGPYDPEYVFEALYSAELMHHGTEEDKVNGSIGDMIFKGHTYEEHCKYTHSGVIPAERVPMLEDAEIPEIDWSNTFVYKIKAEEPIEVEVAQAA